jgi:UDP-N-acetylglucosamine--N-acetylmuramyl-(pentapeptide) pyrophosphoryl-undecaprenol N-acetylglucosamine transferase
MRIAVAGGGTAGHVFPGLALAEILRDRGHDVEFLGTEEGLEARLVPAAGFAFRVIRASPFVRKISLASARAPFVAAAAVRQSRRHLRGAHAVIGVGGYVSVPAVLAARRERIPVVLHEQNAVPGLANRALSRVARAVALSFSDAARYFPSRARTLLTGNPVRELILRVREDRAALAKEARAALGLDESRRTILVFGGSQGALHVDRAAVGACRLLRSRADLQVVMITGPAHLEECVKGLGSLSVGEGERLLVRTVGFLERMDWAYACADLVVSRSGATSVAEATVCGLPALLIPYPYATRRHQEANARALQRAGAAAVLLDEQLSAHGLAQRVESLVDHHERLASMAERSRRFGAPEAGERLADLVEESATAPDPSVEASRSERPNAR